MTDGRVQKDGRESDGGRESGRHNGGDSDRGDPGSRTDSANSSLPTPCPECETQLETREDAMVHAFAHAGSSTEPDGDV